MKRKLSPPPTKPGSVHRRVPADQAIKSLYNTVQDCTTVPGYLNLNASKPSTKSLGGNIIGCRNKKLYIVLKGFPNGVTYGRQNNIGEKPAVTLYTYIISHSLSM